MSDPIEKEKHVEKMKQVITNIALSLQKLYFKWTQR